MLMAQLGWRAIFLLFGLVSLLWLVPWLTLTRDASLAPAETSRGGEPSFRSILARRELWGACIGHFSSNYAFYFVITWLPLYLVKSRGFTLTEMATLSGAVFLLHAASAQISGWAADRWIRNGATVNRVRKTTIIVSHIVVAAAMLGCAFGDTMVCIASLLFAGLSFGPGSANVFAIGQTLAGPLAAGKWVGVQNCLGNISGVVGPLITGFIVEQTGNFVWAFVVSCGITLLGVIAWGVIIPRVAPLAWPQHR
jgi:cyanate permease